MPRAPATTRTQQPRPTPPHPIASLTGQLATTTTIHMRAGISLPVTVEGQRSLGQQNGDERASCRRGRCWSARTPPAQRPTTREGGDSGLRRAQVLQRNVGGRIFLILRNATALARRRRSLAPISRPTAARHNTSPVPGCPACTDNAHPHAPGTALNNRSRSPSA